MKQNLGAVWSGRAARRPPPAACEPPGCRPVVMSIEADLTGHPAMASLSSPRSGCLRARGRCPASSAPRTPGPPRARGVNQLTGLSNQHTRMGKLCLAIVCFWQLLVALRRSNQPVVLSWLLSPRVLIGNKTGFWSARGATSLVPFPPRRRSCRGRLILAPAQLGLGLGGRLNGFMRSLRTAYGAPSESAKYAPTRQGTNGFHNSWPVPPASTSSTM
jgi:hypothetical protein